MDIEDVLDILSVELIGIISDEEEIVISSNRGIPVAALEKSITLESYMDIAKRVLGDEIPFRNIEKKESVIKKLAHSLGF